MKTHHLIYQSIESTLSLNYFCQKCSRNLSFIKLNIPKKKRKTKEVQKELAMHRYDSPVKNRRKSLMNLFKEEECPITIPQLIIELMKSPIHKEMNCECGEPLKKLKLHFQKVPDILIIQIARISKDGNTIDKTPIQLSTATLDLGPFTMKPEDEIIYDFQSAICIEKGCLYPILVIGHFNNQPYIIRNEIVQLSKEKMNPYLLCYRKRPSSSAQQKLTEIQDDLASTSQKQFILPDFWYLQLQNGIERPFKNQFVCKHNFLKPNISSKMKHPLMVSSCVYEDLQHFYQSESIEELTIRNSTNGQGSPNLRQFQKLCCGKARIYDNQICQLCSEQVEQLQLRRKKQRQLVLMYDRLKGINLPYCMISASWIKKWSNFLYNKQNYAYMPKGYPFPLSIDNKVLLEGNKCKANLVKNEDFKILNIYLWKFLKELYGGGPEIRYKWKEGRQNLDEEMLADIKCHVAELKMLYCPSFPQSPKKLMTSLSFIQKSSLSILEEGGQSPSRHPHMMIQEMEDIQELELQKRQKE